MAPPGRKPASKEENSTRTVVMGVLLAVGILYLAFSGGGDPAPHPAAQPQTSGSAGAITPAVLDALQRERGSCDAKFPALVKSANTPEEQKRDYCECIVDLGIRLDGSNGGTREEWLRYCRVNVFQEAAVEVKRMPMVKVTDEQIAAIPADKLELYKQVCDGEMATKAKEYGADPEVFKQLNQEFYRNCLVNKSAPPQVVQ